MNLMCKQIKSAMRVEEVSGDGPVRGRFVFGPHFIGFQGHFPGRPVLPGVCMIQAALMLLKAVDNKPLRLRRVVSAKFFTPVTAGDELRFESVRGSVDAGSVKVTVNRGEEKAAWFHLQVRD